MLHLDSSPEVHDAPERPRTMASRVHVDAFADDSDGSLKAARQSFDSEWGLLRNRGERGRGEGRVYPESWEGASGNLPHP